MSNTPLRVNQSMHERYMLLLEKSLVETPLVTKDYLIFRFSNYNQNSYETGNRIERDHFISIYDRDDSYSFILEVGMPFHPLAVNGDRNKLFIFDSYESDKIVIGIYELDF